MLKRSRSAARSRDEPAQGPLRTCARQGLVPSARREPCGSLWRRQRSPFLPVLDFQLIVLDPPVSSRAPCGPAGAVAWGVLVPPVAPRSQRRLGQHRAPASPCSAAAALHARPFPPTGGRERGCAARPPLLHHLRGSEDHRGGRQVRGPGAGPQRRGTDTCPGGGVSSVLLRGGLGGRVALDTASLRGTRPQHTQAKGARQARGKSPAGWPRQGPISIPPQGRAARGSPGPAQEQVATCPAPTPGSGKET